jgi:tetratricopeptide (TPR) repeat protein
MRRTAILAISFLAVVPITTSAFAQTSALKGAAAATGAATSGTHEPKPKSEDENKAVLAMGKATDVDQRIKLADALMTKYPDTEYKGLARLIEAAAYHQKGDDVKSVIYGEESLEADPNNFKTLLLMADIYSQSTHNTDLDMEDRLGKSDKYAQEALVLLKTASKPDPKLSDSDWNNAKKGEESRAFIALGLDAIIRGKFNDAKTNIEKGMDLYADPLDMLRIDRAYCDAKRYDDAIAWSDKAASAPGASDELKHIAAQDKINAQILKKKK